MRTHQLASFTLYRSGGQAVAARRQASFRNVASDTANRQKCLLLSDRRYGKVATRETMRALSTSRERGDRCRSSLSPIVRTQRAKKWFAPFSTPIALSTMSSVARARWKRAETLTTIRALGSRRPRRSIFTTWMSDARHSRGGGSSHRSRTPTIAARAFPRFVRVRPRDFDGPDWALIFPCAAT